MGCRIFSSCVLVESVEGGVGGKNEDTAPGGWSGWVESGVKARKQPRRERDSSFPTFGILPPLFPDLHQLSKSNIVTPPRQKSILFSRGGDLHAARKPLRSRAAHRSGPGGGIVFIKGDMTGLEERGGKHGGMIHVGEKRKSEEKSEIGEVGDRGLKVRVFLDLCS